MRELIGSLGMALVIIVAAIIVWGRLDALVQQEHEVVETLTRLEHDMNADFALVLKPVPQSAGNTTAAGGPPAGPPAHHVGNGTAPVDDNSAAPGTIGNTTIPGTDSVDAAPKQ